MNEILYWSIFSGVSLAVSATALIQSQDEVWDGTTPTIVEEAAASINETGLTDDPGYWDGNGFWHYENEV